MVSRGLASLPVSVPVLSLPSKSVDSLTSFQVNPPYCFHLTKLDSVVSDQ